jgi:hypothetical protein
VGTIRQDRVHWAALAAKLFGENFFFSNELNGAAEGFQGASYEFPLTRSAVVAFCRMGQ